MLVITGPSGGGKTSVIKGIIEKQNKGEITTNFGRVVTTTTRIQRKGEVNGVHYNFLSHDEFEDDVRIGAFIEHVVHNTHRYGTRRRDLMAVRGAGKQPLIALETIGALNFKNHCREWFGDSIMVIAIDVPEPKDTELQKRLRLRGDSPYDITKRTAIAQWERKKIEELRIADYCVINAVLERTIAEVVRISSVCPVLT